MLKQVTVFLVFSIGLANSLKEFRSTDQRIEDYDYPVETHVATTEDGFELTMFRIPYSPKLNNSAEFRHSILLLHGFQSNSDCYVSNGPDNSISYALADAGFDVWLGNNRGNTYSRKNINLSPSDSEFWDYNWNEIGVLDVAAMIDYVLKNTTQESLHLIAHSQGTTAYLILLSSIPTYNEKIKTAHLLAPCAFYENANAPQLTLSAPIIGTPGTIGYNLFRNRELLPSNSFFSRFIDTLCGGDNINSWCSPLFNVLIEGPSSNTNQSAFGILLETHPAGCSSNQVIHNSQMASSNRFCKFDFGSTENQERYSQSTPPDYNLANIITETYMYASTADTTCTVADMKILISKMGKVAGESIVPVDDFSHLDFVIGNEAKTYIYDPIIEILKNFEA